jgi:hypothetical protein
MGDTACNEAQANQAPADFAGGWLRYCGAAADAHRIVGEHRMG